MANFSGPNPGLTELNARGKRRQAEMERKTIMAKAGQRRELAGRPRGPRFALIRRIVRVIRGGGD
ncbi:MAG: hypothetical protein F4X03_13270 [Dehalococcoidia bacterium]|nr:hypothetical protein [Dehalococcoidia bacterium]MYD29861.1 hypothetical protein [Dehalococcoidia bacterium]